MLSSLEIRYSWKSSLGGRLKSGAQRHSLAPTQESPGKHSGSPDLVATVLPKDVVGQLKQKPPGSGVWAVVDLETSRWSYSL